MSEKIPVANNTAMPIYVAGSMIPPGETRHFDADQVPPEFRPVAAAAPAAAPVGDPIAALSRATVAVIKAAIPGLSDADLELLGDLEQAKGGQARKGVLEAVAEETLKRGEANLNKPAGGQGEQGSQDGAGETGATANGASPDGTAPAGEAGSGGVTGQ